MLRRSFCPTKPASFSSSAVMPFLTLSSRTIFAGPGGLKGGQSSQSTLAHGTHESQTGHKNINERSQTRQATFNQQRRKKTPEDDAKDPDVLNVRDDPRQFKTHDPFQAQERQLKEEAKFGGIRSEGIRNEEGMMFYEEKDSPEFHDPYFKESEELKRRQNMKVASTNERIHPIRGRGAHKLSEADEQEAQRIKDFEEHLYEESEYLNRKAEEREKDLKKKNPGKTLKGSTTEARKKAQETYDWYYMNPDETISRPALWACAAGVTFTFVWFDGTKSVKEPLWSGAGYMQNMRHDLSYDAPTAVNTTLNPLEEKMRRLDRDAAAANPLHKASQMNPLKLARDREMDRDVTVTKSVVTEAAEKESKERAEKASESEEAGMNLSLIGRTRVGL